MPESRISPSEYWVVACEDLSFRFELDEGGEDDLKIPRERKLRRRIRWQRSWMLSQWIPGWIALIDSWSECSAISVIFMIATSNRPLAFPIRLNRSLLPLE